MTGISTTPSEGTGTPTATTLQSNMKVECSAEICSSGERWKRSTPVSSSALFVFHSFFFYQYFLSICRPLKRLWMWSADSSDWASSNMPLVSLSRLWQMCNRVSVLIPWSIFANTGNTCFMLVVASVVSTFEIRTDNFKQTTGFHTWHFFFFLLTAF